MAKKTRKRITINAFERAAEQGLPELITIEWTGINIEIKPTLSLGEMYGFVNGVVSACVDTTTGVYNAEIKDFAIKMMVLENYANFTLPKNSEKSYDLIYRTDAFFKVRENINPVQFEEMCNAIDEKIEYVLKSNIETANRQINEMYTSMDGIQNQLSSLLSEINEDDIKNLLGALTKGDVDEEKLMNAYLSGKTQDNSQPTIIETPTK